jgi:hypothetical protein
MVGSLANQALATNEALRRHGASEIGIGGAVARLAGTRGCVRRMISDFHSADFRTSLVRFDSFVSLPAVFRLACCSALPSDPASQLSPAASRSLRLHQAVKRTFTSKPIDPARHTTKKHGRIFRAFCTRRQFRQCLSMPRLLNGRAAAVATSTIGSEADHTRLV